MKKEVNLGYIENIRSSYSKGERMSWGRIGPQIAPVPPRGYLMDISRTANGSYTVLDTSIQATNCSIKDLSEVNIGGGESCRTVPYIGYTYAHRVHMKKPKGGVTRKKD